MNRPTNDETVKQLKIDKVILDPAISYPVNTFVRRSLTFINSLGYKNTNRKSTLRIGKAPWQPITKYVIAEDKSLDDNITLLDYIENNFKNSTTIFTDGSKITNIKESTASGLHYPQKRVSIAWRLNPIQSVLGAELFAIYQALILIKSEKDQKNYLIFSDSMTALQMIQIGSGKYRDYIAIIQKLLLKLNEERKITIHWIRAHIGIKGNEIADRTANLGHNQNKSTLSIISMEEQVDSLKYLYKIYWDQQWQEEVTTTQKGKF